MTIDKGLSFRVEATPHEGLGSKGLSVKVKVRKKQDAGTQYDTILKIKKAGSHDKTIHLVQSEETMTSFDMLVEKQKPGVKKRGSFLRNFKPGGCLDPPLDEDEYKYKPKTATPKSSKSSSSLDSKQTCKYKKHGAACVETKKEEKEHPIEKSSSASVMSLFKDVPTANLNARSSNTIITYPPHAKRSKVSTSSSKKSIDEKRKKSFSQTTELYFKPKPEETGAKSPSKVSKAKNISREGHRSVDSDNLLPYIQEVAKAQMSYIQDDPIFNKNLSQLVPVSDVKIREDDAIISDFNNNRGNEMLSGRAATLSDANINPLHDYTIASEKADRPVSDVKIREDDAIVDDYNNNRRNEMLSGRAETLSEGNIKPLHDNTIASEKADNIAMASAAAGLTVAGLAAAGLTAAAIKQPQDEDQTLHTRGEEPPPSAKLEEENLVKEGSLKDDKLQPQAPLTDSKSGISKLDSHVINKDETKDHTENLSNQSQLITGFEKQISDSTNAAKFNEISKPTSNEDLKSKLEMEPIEKTSVTATHNKELINEGSRDKIIQTKPTDTESLRQEHDKKVSSILDEPKTEEATKIGIDNVASFKSAPINEFINKDDTQSSGLPQSKNTSVISLAKDINKQSITKLMAGSRLSSQSKISKRPSRDSKIDAKDSKPTPSPRGSNRSVKLTPDENKASTQPMTAKVFPLHKATSSHSTQQGDFLITSSPKKSSFTDSVKPIINETALANEAEDNVVTDAKTTDTNIPLPFGPQTDLAGSQSSTTALHQETGNNLTSLLDATSSLLSTANKALSTFGPLRSYSEDDPTRMERQGSAAGSQTEVINIQLPYIRASFDKEVNTESQSKFLQDPVSQELGSFDKEAELQLDSTDDNIIVAKKSSDISARDSKQSVNHKQGSTLLQKPITGEVGSVETPVLEPGYQTIKPATATGIEDDIVTDQDILNDFTATAESAKTFLRTGERPSRDSITSSLAPPIDIDQTDQFLVDIAFEFSRNPAAKHTIIKTVDAESASNLLSKRNNIISHKSTTSNLFEQPIEIPINPKYNVSLKLNSKQKRKTEKKQSRISIVSFSGKTSKHSNKVKTHSNIESNTRRKGMDINTVLETIYKEQLQPLELNMKKLKAEIQLLTQEQAYIQRSINNLTEKRSSLRANRVKRSLSCLCKRNIPNTLQYPSFTMQ